MAEKHPKKWIAKAINPRHEGQFAAKAKAAGMSTRAFAERHKHDSEPTGGQARLALQLMGMPHGRQRQRTAAEKRKTLYGRA